MNSSPRQYQNVSLQQYEQDKKEPRNSQFIPYSKLGFNNANLNTIPQQQESETDSNHSPKQLQNSNSIKQFKNSPFSGQNNQLSQFMQQNQNLQNSQSPKKPKNENQNNYNNNEPSKFFTNHNDNDEIEDIEQKLLNWEIKQEQNEGQQRMTYIKQVYEPENIEKKNKKWGYLVLFIGILSASSLGPFFKVLDPPAMQSQTLKSLYRQQIMIFLNIFLVIYEYRKARSNQYQTTMYTSHNLKNLKSNLKLIFASLCFTCYILTVPLSVNQPQMEIFTAYAFFGIYPSVVVIYKLIKGLRCSYNEKVGLFVSIVCYVFIFIESKSLSGCLYALLGGLAYTIYTKTEDTFKDFYPELMSQFVISFWSMLFLLFFCFIFVTSNSNFLLVFTDSNDILIYITMGVCTGVIVAFCVKYCRSILRKQVIQTVKGSYPFFSMFIAFIFGEGEFRTDIQTLLILVVNLLAYALIFSGKTESENDDFNIALLTNANNNINNINAKNGSNTNLEVNNIVFQQSNQQLNLQGKESSLNNQNELAGIELAALYNNKQSKISYTGLYSK